MPGVIEVIDGGIGNTIQDSGRTGFRHIGLAVSGYLDAYLARCANALVGNPDSANCACIEIRAVGPRLLVHEGPVRLALAGEISATLYRNDDEARKIRAWRSFTAFPEDEIEFDYLPGGSSYLAVQGGIDSPVQLGSRSTYQHALIGGIDGRQIMTGDMLSCAVTVDPAEPEKGASTTWSYNRAAPVRVVLGPQDELFQKETITRFGMASYRVTPQIDRMGMRLEGPELTHVLPSAADIVSDCVTPGAIQVPGDGQPIILLADCQTVGGYPKIATVIRADLPRLGQCHPEETLRFQPVGLPRARLAFLEMETRWSVWARGMTRAEAIR